MSTATLDEMLACAEKAVRCFGLGSLRTHQREVLRNLAEHRAVFAGLPTGYGKSLCYWLPARAWGWKVWVISPLVSLIQDQAISAKARGLRVVAWQGKLTDTQRAEREEEMQSGAWEVCFLSPERFVAWAENGYLHSLRCMGLDADLLVLDEMHCMEEWREFRSAYRNLGEHFYRSVSGGTLFLGLSASLSAFHGRAWMAEFCGDHALVQAGLGRKNLSLEVLPLEREEERWLEVVSYLRELHAPQSALVYCHSRGECDDLARWLKSAGIPAVAYHAGLPQEERTVRSLAFREGRLRVICATSAFGMGIDYPHVECVVHFSMPHDLESYWQEVGRAGRSGAPARALAFWRRSEITRARILQAGSRERFAALWKAWAEGGCRVRAVASRLGMQEDECGRCDRCQGKQILAWWLEPEAQLDAWLEQNFNFV
ncbi:MAG TPA: RecQ family ATP-dependent DNA helicase [Bdellovibrionota bacterium]|jgi:ATP-dependent DNA helicase RecQ